ncbi:MAG: sulfate adenylyltransferase [Deltaproteobacteria bacterium]|jgi:sulfate adenylyltransferase subunit 1 (EFTu-like GTPase family)|nr:sulfate adenylyltransferase [Deltaproteobacteria bacterium]
MNNQNKSFQTREKLKLVFTGHVDHGKSTVIGRLLLDSGALPQGAVDKIRRVSAETGRPFELAYLLDAFEEEQAQGITIDTTQLQFKTAFRDYVIIDAPGHKEFLKNMISGASDAEAAFLVVDAERGLEEQSKRHAHMLALLGLQQSALIVNKMDLVGFSQQVYQQTVEAARYFLSSLGLKLSVAVPLSALMGLNVTVKAPELSWHDGPTLLEALDSLKKSGHSHEAPLRLPIQDVFKFDDRRVLVGRVESGQIAVSDSIVISPGGKTAQVVSLASWLPRDQKTKAETGESVAVIISEDFFNRRGEIVSRIERAPKTVNRFRASIFWMGRRPLKAERRYKLKLSTAESECEIVKLFNLIDSSTLKPLQAQGEVGFNEVAEVEISLQKELALDLFSQCQATGRFVLVDDLDVAGGGIVTWAEDKPQVKAGFVHGELKARCELFQEYFYDLDRMTFNKIESSVPFYAVGDPVPLSGESYLYPEFFDIVIFRDQIVVKIRDGLVGALSPFSEYRYEGYPLVNGRGFAVKVNSEDDWLKLNNELLLINNRERAVGPDEKWLDFNVYRRIRLGRDRHL